MFNAICYGLLWALLRRWYGGWGENIPVIGSRTFQSIVMICALIPMFLITEGWLGVLIAVVDSVWIQFQHWSRAIGCILDAGRNHNQNESNYNRWYRYPLDWVYKGINWILNKLNISYQLQLYSGYYDFWYSILRYGCPMLPLAFISWGYVLIGCMAAPCYFLAWRLFENNPKMYQLPEWAGQPKNLAELMYGFVFGFGIAFIKIFIL